MEYILPMKVDTATLIRLHIYTTERRLSLPAAVENLLDVAGVTNVMLEGGDLPVDATLEAIHALGCEPLQGICLTRRHMAGLLAFAGGVATLARCLGLTSVEQAKEPWQKELIMLLDMLDLAKQPAPADGAN